MAQQTVTRPRRQAWAIGALLAVFVLLSLSYNAVQPLFEAPDEGDHFAYADYLARERRLPDLAHDLAVSHEIIQPPLYYAAVALLIGPFDRSNLADISRLNPDWFDKDVNANHRSVANQYIHTAAETFPYQGAARAVHVARLFSTLLGALTVLLVYATARMLADVAQPADGAGLLPFLAAALTALNPKFIHVSSIVSNDIAITFAATLACWWMVRIVIDVPSPLSIFRSRASFLLLGIMVGIAVLSKVTGLALLVPAGLLVVYKARQSPAAVRFRDALLSGLLIAAGLALAAGPWLIYNAVHYGSPLAWSQVQAANQTLLRQPPLNLPQLIGAMPEVLVSYWGVIGIELRYPPWVDWVFAVGLVAAVLGVVRLAYRAWRRRATEAALRYPLFAALSILLVWELALFISYAAWLRDYVGTENSRLILPGVALVVIAVAAGWLALLPAKARTVVAALACAGMALLSAATPFALIQPAFAAPAYLTDAQRAALPGQSGVSFGGKIRLQHAQIDSRSVQPGRAVAVSVYWGAQQPLRQSYHAILSARDAQGNLIGRLEAIPFNGRFDTQRWAVGRIFRDDYQLPIDATAQRGIATVQIAVRGVYEKPPLLPVDGSGSGQFTIGEIKVLGPLQPVAAPQYTFDAVFAGAGARLIELQGFDAATRNGRLSLALHWLCLQPPNRDYTLFVHVLDRNGKIIAQQDAQPVNGAYPTSMWDAQEQVIDRRTIAIPGSAASLRLGWYASGTGVRLQALKPDGSRWADDAVTIPLPQADAP